MREINTLKQAICTKVLSNVANCLVIEVSNSIGVCKNRDKDITLESIKDYEFIKITKAELEDGCRTIGDIDRKIIDNYFNKNIWYIAKGYALII